MLLSAGGVTVSAGVEEGIGDGEGVGDGVGDGDGEGEGEGTGDGEGVGDGEGDTAVSTTPEAPLPPAGTISTGAIGSNEPIKIYTTHTMHIKIIFCFLLFTGLRNTKYERYTG